MLSASAGDAILRGGETGRAAALPPAASLPPALGTALQILATAEATGLTPPPGGADARGTANLVIFNAAMLPGWPYPTAFARDGAPGSKAVLQQVGATLAAMSPEEMAEYLAKVGAGFALVRRLRKEMETIAAEERHSLLGLFALLSQAVNDVLAGFAASTLFSAEEAAEMEAVRNGGIAGRKASASRQRLPI
ncbi:hypothetical protein [Pseudooceanicola aestuarii]|uniref:hypothetical protein n=1 Tax=Pseudooceanicola aestuarii TaxID=2697319 RepID=UPI0013D16E72|nr:hypothetical protein [Pseudooceanicola aestuarii]